MALPLGIALPAMADEATDSTAFVLPEEETSTPELPIPEGETPSVNPSETPMSLNEEASENTSVAVDPEPSGDLANTTPSLESGEGGIGGDLEVDADVDPSIELGAAAHIDLLNQSVETSGTVAPSAVTSDAATSAVTTNVHRFLLSNNWKDSVNVDFTWGDANYEVLIGDWDGDGKDSVALRKGNQFAFSNENPASAAPKFTFTLGNASDTVVVGDWNGDGKDSIALRRGNMFYVKNNLSGTEFASIFSYGKASDEIFVGDWDGNGTDTLAVRRGNQIHISNTNGKTDKVVDFGRVSDDLYVGSFDRSRPGLDSFAVRRGNTYFISKAIKSGNADIQLNYGRVDDVTLVGDWNGDGVDTLGVARAAAKVGSGQAAPPAVKKSTGAQVLAYARTFEGKVPYVRGGKTTDGWDCIGMIRYVYYEYGVTVGPKPISVLEAGREVPYSEAKPGDLLYWPAERNMIGTNDHVGIYIDETTNFGAGRSKGTSVVQTKWKGKPPTVIRVFD